MFYAPLGLVLDLMENHQWWRNLEFSSDKRKLSVSHAKAGQSLFRADNDVRKIRRTNIRELY